MSCCPPAGGAHPSRHPIDYLLTTFALSDASVRDALDDFLADPVGGMFKGPYMRLRLPFEPAAPGWGRAGMDEGPSRRTAIRRRRSRGSRRRSTGVPSAAADDRHHRDRIGKDRGVPLPDHRSRPAGPARRRHRHEGADPLSDERAGQ